MLNFGVYVSLTLMNLLMDQKQRYAQWVDKVSRFLEEIGPTLGNRGRCCSVFNRNQSSRVSPMSSSLDIMLRRIMAIYLSRKSAFGMVILPSMQRG